MVDITAEDLCYMLVKMKNQSTGIIEVSKIATGTEDELRFVIYGDKGAVKFNLRTPITWTL